MKIFVLGLDGATFDLLNPMMDEGVIPNIKEIVSNYSSGPLETIFPPVTGPACFSGCMPSGPTPAAIQRSAWIISPGKRRALKM